MEGSYGKVVKLVIDEAIHKCLITTFIAATTSIAREKDH